MVYRGQKGSLVNMDLTTNNILVGPDEGSLFSGNPDTFILGPLNSGYADGTKDLWAIALTGTPTVAFMEGLQNWQPSPAQIQEQLNALGLATEATQQTVASHTLSTANNVSTVNTTLGTPAQKSDVNQVNTTLGIPAQKSDVNQVNTTLGVPAQTADITTMAGGKSLATINTTLGVPAQTADVGALHAAGKTIAVESSLTGVPALRLVTNLGFNTAQALAGGANINLLNNAVITQQGLQLILWLEFATPTPTISFAELRFIWTDGTSGLSGPTESLELPGGQSAFCVFIGDVPARSQQLTVKLTNLDPALILSYSWAINQISHPVYQLRVAENNLVNVWNFTRPAGAPLDKILCSASPTITVGTPQDRLAATWTGRASFNIDNSGQANPVIVSLKDPANLYSPAGSDILYGPYTIPAGGQQTVEVGLPNGPVLVHMINAGTTGTIAPTVNLTRIDD